MTTRVLIIGGYGNFGSYISKALASDDKITVLVGGRSLGKAQAFIATLAARNKSEALCVDINGDLDSDLKVAKPDVVIHAVGPFQNQDYRVAQACVRSGCHYIDLADARRFVCDVSQLDAAAKVNEVLVVSGASSVPCLTAAVVDAFLPEFSPLLSLDYGISAAQQTNRGLATTSAILSYVGKPISMWQHGRWRDVFGWQDFHIERYPELGVRLFGNCDIPDLELFPARYPSIKEMRFSAGHELKILHLGTWVLSWFVRLKLIRSLAYHATLLLKFAFMFDFMGSAKSGFHMIMKGQGLDGENMERRFYIIAKSGHGPYIPCMPAILLAKKLARGEIVQRGARPCLDMIGLDEYLAALQGLDIRVVREDPGNAGV